MNKLLKTSSNMGSETLTGITFLVVALIGLALANSADLLPAEIADAVDRLLSVAGL